MRLRYMLLLMCISVGYIGTCTRYAPTNVGRWCRQRQVMDKVNVPEDQTSFDYVSEAKLTENCQVTAGRRSAANVRPRLLIVMNARPCNSNGPTCVNFRRKPVRPLRKSFAASRFYGLAHTLIRTA